jgi:outer membrane protein TolC
VAGLTFVLPLTWRKLQAQVASARALVDASRAVLRQAEADREAEVAAGLAVLENVERQQRLWTESLLPNWQLRCQSVRRAYEAGAQSLGEWVQAELARLAAEEALVELQTLREQQLVRLETLLGLPGEGGFSATQEASHAAR